MSKILLNTSSLTGFCCRLGSAAAPEPERLECCAGLVVSQWLDTSSMRRKLPRTLPGKSWAKHLMKRSMPLRLEKHHSSLTSKCGIPWSGLETIQLIIANRFGQYCPPINCALRYLTSLSSPKAQLSGENPTMTWSSSQSNLLMTPRPWA